MLPASCIDPSAIKNYITAFSQILPTALFLRSDLEQQFFPPRLYHFQSLVDHKISFPHFFIHETVEMSLQLVLLNNPLSNQNVQMENCMQSLLIDFYSAVTRAHHQKQQRIEMLDHFLSKLRTDSRCFSEAEKQRTGIEYQTQTSFGDLETSSLNPKPTNVFTSNMLYTFLQPSPENEKESRYKVTSQKAFNHCSIFKIIPQALFINFLHINKEASQVDNQYNFSQPLAYAAQSIKKLKIAMVSAAQHFKSKDRKKYTKIRYLYDQLLNYTDNSCNFKEEYIRVIIDEFEDDFLQGTFECLRKKCNELHASHSLSNIELGDSILKDSMDLSQMDRALEYLQMKLIVRSDSDCASLQLYGGHLNVVIEQSQRQGFLLSEVITMRSSQE